MCHHSNETILIIGRKCIQLLELSIINKLADGPQCLRDLTRRFYRLPSAECHELLLDMEASGRVAHSKGRWQLARSGLLTVARDRDLVLEA